MDSWTRGSARPGLRRTSLESESEFVSVSGAIVGAISIPSPIPGLW